MKQKFTDSERTQTRLCKLSFFLLSFLILSMLGLSGCSSDSSSKEVKDLPSVPSPSVSTTTLDSATSDGIEITLTYDSNLNSTSIPSASSFSISVDGANGVSPSSLSLSGAVVTLVLPSPVIQGQSLTVSYNRSLTPPLLGSDGNRVANLSGQVVTISQTHPGAVRSLVALSESTQVALSWGAPSHNGGSGITKYQYRVSVDSGVNWNPNWTDIPDGSDSGNNAGDESGYTVTGLTNNQAYLFQVRAVNAQGSGFVQEATETPLTSSTTILSSATSDGIEITLTYNSNLNATSTPSASSFSISVDGANGVFPSSLSLSGTVVTLVLPSPVVQGQSLTVSYNRSLTPPLLGSDGNRVGNLSGRVVTISQTHPGAVRSLVTRPENTQVVLSWEAPSHNGGSGITKYQYRVSVDSGVNWNPNWTDIPDGSDSGNNAGDESGYTVTGLTNDQAYLFQVRAVNAQGSGFVQEATATPLILPTPNSLAVAASYRKLTFTWSLSAGASEPSYYVLTQVFSASSSSPDRIVGNKIAGNALTYDLPITSRFRFDWSNATYKLSACNEGSSATNTTCYDSVNITVTAADSLNAILKAKASDAREYDNFGISVSLDGDTLAVGAYQEDSNAANDNPTGAIDSGAVYVFTRTNGTWGANPVKLKASDAGEDDSFGTAVSLDGDTLAAGANEEDSNAANDNPTGASNSGAVYVFTRTNGTWGASPIKLKASDAGEYDHFGRSVSLDGDTLAVGASVEDSNAANDNPTGASNSGAVYVFTRTNGTWGANPVKLKASDAGEDDSFGTAVSLDGDTLAVGANVEDSNAANDNPTGASNSGAVYVFTRTNGTWDGANPVKLKANDAGSSDYFGTVVSLDGDTLAVGAGGEDSNAANDDDDGVIDSGAVYVFTRTNGTWDKANPIKLKANDAEEDDSFGAVLSLDGDTLAVGAYQEDSNAANDNPTGANNSGAVYVFTRTNGTWDGANPVKLKANDAGEYDYFGRSVSLDGDTLAVGAHEEDSNAANDNSTGANNSGAIYLH